MPKEKIFNDQDTQIIINLYNSKLSCKKIGIKFNCSKQTINKVLKLNNIHLRDNSHSKQIYDIDENIFEKIDTNEKAYWLGMLTGDGWITKTNDFGLSLEQNDKYIIYKFRDFLKSNHPIRRMVNCIKNDGTESVSYVLCITNKKIVYDLKQYGFTNDKTHNMIFPKIEDKLLSNYMLGLIDSDGCFCIKTRNNNNKQLSFSFVGTTEFVKSFQDILIDKCSISRTKLDIQKNTNFIRIVHYGGYKNIYKIVKFLYDNPVIFMNRKKNIAFNYLLTKYPEDKWLINNI